LGALSACTTDVGQPTFQVALNETIKDADVLSKACKRPISENDARSATQSTTFSDFSSKRGVFAKDGTGKVTFTYRPSSGGAPCTAEMAFDFHQESTMKRYSKRNVSYSSTIELLNVVVTPK
jgi:hypothetical protein